MFFEQTRKILDHMWCSEKRLEVNAGQKSDWRIFKKEMLAGRSMPLLRTMLLFGPMVICRIPLSAATRVNRLFVLAYIQYGESLTAFGLLAKHARQEEAIRHLPRSMFSVGQHLPSTSGAPLGSQFGKDHFLVDPSSKVPVGILPDILSDNWTNEQYANMTSAVQWFLSGP
jgi:hypothetical protein